MAVLNVVKQVFWPLAAPVSCEDRGVVQRWWRVLCALLVIPGTAAFHNAVFYPRECILNNFGPDYTLTATWQWFSRDPSMPWAIIVAVVIYHVGNAFPKVKLLVAPVFLCSLPLTIWVWDIPGSGRFICEKFHDGRFMLTETARMRARYLYLFGMVLWASFAAYLLLKQRTKQHPASSVYITQPAAFSELDDGAESDRAAASETSIGN